MRLIAGVPLESYRLCIADDKFAVGVLVTSEVMEYVTNEIVPLSIAYVGRAVALETLAKSERMVGSYAVG